jgi:hypothetical protein
MTMNYYNVQNDQVTGIAQHLMGIEDQRTWVSRHDLNSVKDAQVLADKVTAFAGKPYIATDAGSSTYPRFDVIEAPQVGDKVSYSFNGDSYPCGVITSISKTGKRITTSEGKIFNRYKQTGSYKSHGWYMVSGWIEERNPHF